MLTSAVYGTIPVFWLALWWAWKEGDISDRHAQGYASAWLLALIAFLLLRWQLAWMTAPSVLLLAILVMHAWPQGLRIRR